MGERYAGCCEVCDATDPAWTVLRIGDAVVSWACPDHLAVVCEGLQRDFEVTRLEVTYGPKARDVAEINRLIRTEMGP